MYCKHPVSEKEKALLSALQAFGAGNMDSQSDLFRAYHRLLFSIEENPGGRERTLPFIFSALTEALDNAPDGEISEVLYLYTFREFLENYADVSAVQDAIVWYLDHYFFRKPALQTALGLRRRK